VLSYYQNSITLNAEGDTSISEETLEGLGRLPNFLDILFGVIVQLAQPPKLRSSTPVDISPANTAPEVTASEGDTMFKDNYPPSAEATQEAEFAQQLPLEEENEKLFHQTMWFRFKNGLLTEILPDPGYFAAGAVAGVFSRTFTAPLDRIKVYLIANIGSSSGTLKAARGGDAALAARKLGQPLVDAARALWKTGGMRSLFAGKL
jgi:solute carrier family 25 phosphate transporter 23/24/25/41